MSYNKHRAAAKLRQKENLKAKKRRARISNQPETKYRHTTTMITSELKKLDQPTEKHDSQVYVKIDCPNAKLALQEYSYITARIRDMILENSPRPLTMEEINSTVFSAFTIGMESIPMSKEAHSKIAATKKRDLP